MCHWEGEKEGQGKHAEAVQKWKDQEEKQKQKCAEINTRYQVEMQAWNEEKELAKAEKRCARLKKPVWGPLPKAAPKPKKDSVVDEQSGEEFGEEMSGLSGSDREWQSITEMSQVSHTM